MLLIQQTHQNLSIVQSHNMLILLFCSSKSCSSLETGFQGHFSFVAGNATGMNIILHKFSGQHLGILMKYFPLKPNVPSPPPPPLPNDKLSWSFNSP